MMKKSIFALLLAAALMVVSTHAAVGQEEPKPRKDSVNMDTIAKPTFYYAIEDEGAGKVEGKKGNAGTVVIIAAVVVIAAGVGFFLARKKK